MHVHEATFDDRFTRTFPADPNPANLPRQVRGALYSVVPPTPVKAPRLIAWSEDAGELLGLSRPEPRGPAADVLGGNLVLPGMTPFASCYGGHQFGTWAGQLGDGRALTLGELKGWEVQLKGAGPTPYSRRGDGRAVLRSSVREFLCSEIMHFLGVPTTRALSLVATGDAVIRDMFYDGRPEAEPGAICTRLSPSFIRFGHFEILAQRGEDALLRQLAEFVREHYYPEFATHAEWFQELCRRTARLMVDWLRVGFVHGVMNTDNMSILGLTIDYGPYGWLDDYDPAFTPNTTDVGGRYAYARQPAVALWNLQRLAGALVPLVESTRELEQGLEAYVDTFNREHPRMMAAKLGLHEPDDELVEGLLRVLVEAETDMTLFFRGLADGNLEDAFYQGAPPGLDGWLEEHRRREPDRELMHRTNPRIIPRNYLVQQVIERAEQGEAQAVDDFLAAFRRPYDEALPEHERKRPDWARHAPGCSALSCSS